MLMPGKNGFGAVKVLVTMELPNIFRMTGLSSSHNARCVTQVFNIFCSGLCVAAEIGALVLFCDPLNVLLVALVSVVIVIHLIELLIDCLPMEPSHELKEIRDNTVKLCSAIHLSLTTAVIFVGVLKLLDDHAENRDLEQRLVDLMIAYTVLNVLIVIRIYVDITLRKKILARSKKVSAKNGEKGRQQRKKEPRAAEVCFMAVSGILAVGILCFSVAIIIEISLLE
ncbi:uncharacterized protein LOC131978165 [Centropristis striata]|uniref:uncharacterized protein LOC131978165 n=1 Tax=Centropristis striata TaxID=184440 RepID=UPI0027DF60D7|nr:uncharacterized protein LOC131978165 [Centropristis striata]